RERQVGEARGIRPASRSEKGFERARVRRRRQPLTEACRQLDDALPALRGTEDPTQRRGPPRVEELRGDFVGRDHVVLDQLLGTVLLVGEEIEDYMIAANEVTAKFL